ncbi:MCE family protein [Nonomuraea spiralis]|uniref:MCE family protein n=1 Tax=Nonomuraea spiralis TaxID=46182 RepID=UPI0037BB8DD1
MSRSDLSLAARTGIAVAVVVVVAAAAFLVVRAATEVGGTRIDAVFTRAGQGMDTNSKVKIRGVTVGDVTDVTLDAKGRAVVTMHLQPGVKVPRTTVAAVEPLSVFGPKMIDLRPGAGEAMGPYLGSGAVITDTEEPLDLSDTLGDAYRGLDAIDPREVTVIVHTLAKGLDGEGRNLRELIGDAGTLVGVAHRQRGRARQFLHDAAGLGTALSDKGDELVSIASDVNVITPGLLERADKVRALLQEITSVSGLAAHGLRTHREDLRAGGRSGERVAALIYAQLGLAGDGVRGLSRLVDLLNELIEARGPDGSRMLQVEAFVATDVCELIVGACGPTDGRR